LVQSLILSHLTDYIKRYIELKASVLILLISKFPIKNAICKI
jgi:hypothetical protein